MSPNNEEATSQDLSQSGGEASNSGVSDYSGGPPVFNMVYPGYYMNGQCTPTGELRVIFAICTPLSFLTSVKNK